MTGHTNDDECHDDTAHKKDTHSSSKFFDITTIGLAVFRAVDGPVTYFREKVVLPLQTKNKEKFYHRRFNRVPTVDQCDFEDPVCIFEADQQYYRDKNVDSNIVSILRQRKLECLQWEGHDSELKCKQFIDAYEDAATNWFIKYGDMRTSKGAAEAYMKQKHRMIWERRNPDNKMH